MLKSMFLAIALTALSAFTLPQTAQAAPILSQQLLDLDGNILGEISIDLDTVDAFGEVTEWFSFELFGFSPLENLFFIASFDPADLTAGLTFFSFDVSDVDFLYAFQGFFDSGFGFVDVFDVAAGQPVDFTEFTLSNARLVSAPATLFLMLAAAGGLLLRRRQA